MAGELTSLSLAMGRGVVSGSVAPVLADLTVSPSSATVGTAYTGTVSGKTAGSTLTLSGAGAVGLSVSGSSITGTPTASGAVDVIETLAGATGSPKTNAGVVTVAATPSAVALDAPVPASMSSKLVDAFGFDRLFESFSGNSVNVKNNDTSGTSAYGFDSGGRFNVASLPANSDVVSFVSQKGTGNTLAAYTGSTVLALTRSSVAPRLAASMGSDSQLARSTTEGGVGVDLAATGMLQTTTALPVSLSTKGYEVHILWSPNNRKRASNDSTDPFTSDNVRENIICYGTNSNNQMIAYMGGGTSTDFARMQSGGQQNQTTGKGPSGTYRFKAKAQYVTSYVMSQTAFAEIEHGKRTKSIALNAATTTAIQAASMDNGKLGIGGVFASTSNDTLAATNKGNLVFSAVIITEALTDAERFQLQAKLSAIGQQHRVKAKTDIEAYFDELVDMRNVNASTGRVVGKNGLVTVDFNMSGSTFAPNYTLPDFGLVGIRSPDNGVANSFQATSNWFYENTTGSVMRLSFLESGPQNNNLQFDFNMANGNPQVDNRGDASLMFGYHHAVPALGTKLAASIDSTSPSKLGTRLTAAGATFGATLYDGQNQTNGKYNYFTANIGMVYGESFGSPSYTWTQATWENTDGGAPYQLDAPVFKPTPDNLQYPFKPNQLQLHIGTFEAPPGWNPASPDPALFLFGKGRGYVSGGAIQPFGHMDGSYSAVDRTGVRQGNSSHRIQSNPYQYQMMGTRCLWGFRKDKAFTLKEVEEVQVNAYKLVS